MRYLYILAAILFIHNPAFSSKIVSVRPLTSSVLVVHFDDGSIIHHGNGQSFEDDIITSDPLDVVAASLINNYEMISPDDPMYLNLLHPAEVGRKSKGTEFSSLCENWGIIPYFNDLGCLNTSVDHVKEHFIYLMLPHPLQEGKTYTLSLNDLSEDFNEFTFIFDSRTLRSDAVHVNQIGYSTEAPRKFGYVYSWMGDKGGLDLTNYAGNEFDIIDIASGQPVFSGILTFRKDALSVETAYDTDTPNSNFLGAEVYECDFSSFNLPGEYLLSIHGIGTSFPFSISESALRTPFQYVMRGIYQNRSGITLTETYAQERPAPHNVISTPGFAGRLKYTSTTWCDVASADADPNDKALWEAGYKGDLTETWGWYQDAGDWDGYLRHMKVPSYLLFLYENFKDNFSDSEDFNPESGNGQPDILDEARWLIRFYKRLKDEMNAKSWGTGGVGGARIFGDLWGGDTAPDGSGRGSWQDNTRDWYVSGEDPFTTMWYAAIAAHYAICLENAGLQDVEQIDWRSEAVAAYQWTLAHMPASGVCHELELNQLRAYAAASLYKLTGITGYAADYVQTFNELDITSDYSELTDIKAFGVWQYSTLPNDLETDSEVYDKGIGAVESTANFQLLIPVLDNRACRWGGNFWFPMLIGQGTSPKIHEGIMGYAILKDKKPELAQQYKTVMHNTADYFLGNNPLNITWITGLGEQSPQGIFHLDSWYSPSGGVRQGIVPYGPWRRQYFSGYGAWRNEWPALTTYPDYDLFPGHERWFEQRTSPLSCEFTIDQTNLSSAFLYGSLGDKAETVSTKKEPKTEKTEQLMVYPNPVTTLLNFNNHSAQNAEIKVYDALGKIILIHRGVRSSINVEHLNDGVYILEVKECGQRRMGKFVKQK